MSDWIASNLLIIVPLVVFAVLLSYVFFYQWTTRDLNNEEKSKTKLEVFKHISQIVFVGIIGTIITYGVNSIIKEHQRAQEVLVSKNSFRKEFLEGVLKMRSELERSRREYGIEHHENEIKAYEKTARGILEARLQLAYLLRSPQGFDFLFGEKDSFVLSQKTNWMKDYLDHVVREYEAEIPKLKGIKSDDELRKLINSLFWFTDFVSSDIGTVYSSCFIEKVYRPTADAVREKLAAFPDEAPLRCEFKKNFQFPSEEVLRDGNAREKCPEAEPASRVC